MQKLKTKIVDFYSNRDNLWITIFVLLNLILTPVALARNGVTSFKIGALLIIIEILIDALFIFVIKYLFKKELPIEKKYLFLSIMIGLAMIAFIPTGQSPDEYAHMTRAWSISEGHLITEIDETGTAVGNFPVEFKAYRESDNDNKNYRQLITKLQTYQSGETFAETRHYPAAATYNFILYLPQVAGLLIGKLLHLPLVFTLYLGRIFALVTFSILTYFALKLLPKFKSFLVLIALLPITIQQAASFSADSLTIGIAFLLVAYALHLIWEVPRLSKKQVALIYVLSILMALCKVVYFPLCGLFLLIPAKKFGSPKVKWINAGLAVLIAIASEILWLKLQPVSAISSASQIDYIKNHPLATFVTLYGSIDYNLDLYLHGFTGMHLGFFDINLPQTYFYIILFLIAYLLAFDNEKIQIKTSLKAISWTIFITVTFILMGTLYIQWTAPGAKVVDGVQGRYFLPLATLLPLMYHRDHISKQPNPIKLNTIFIVCTFFNICAYFCAYAHNMQF